MSLLKVIADYDNEREAYIDRLETENAELRKKAAGLIRQVVLLVHAHDAKQDKVDVA